MRLIVLGDSKGKKNGVNEEVLRKLLKQIKALNPQPDYIIHLGDLTAGSDNRIKLRSLFEGFRNIFAAMNIKNTIIPVFGNHEGGENPRDYSSELVFRETFNDFLPDGELEGYNSTVYYKDLDNTRLVVLNSCHFHEENKITGEQLIWFRNALAVKRDFKIVFVHIPPYPTGAHYGTSLDLYPEYRNEFWSVVDENRVDIVLAGHEHNYSRRIINDNFSTDRFKFNNQIYQIISGGGGEKLRDKYKSKTGVKIPPIAKYHFIVIDILDKTLVLKARDSEGKIIDELQVKAHVY